MRTASLPDKAYRSLIAMIFDGRLQAGNGLQEAALAAALGMSRTPVSEAIRRLEGEGLAERHGRVARVRLPTAEEVGEVFFLRLQLEPPAARAAVDLPAERIAGMERRVRELVASGQQGGAEQHWRVDDEFHAMIAGATGNRAISRLVAELRQRTCMFDSAQVPERFAAGSVEHLDTLAAIRRGDADAAERTLERHLRNAQAAVLARLERIERSGTAR